MAQPTWDDEDRDMHPTCVNASGELSGSEVAFLNQINNKERLNLAEQTELRRIWFQIGGNL